MALFFLSYDLRKKRDYQSLYDALASFNAVNVLESEWAFRRTNTNAEALRDYFKQFIDSDDRLCVTQVADWATYNVLNAPQNVNQ